MTPDELPVVPVEPTEAMLKAGCAIPGVSLETGRKMWRAMLAASPVVPVGVSKAVLKAAQNILEAATIYEDEFLLADAEIVLAALRPIDTGREA